MKRVLILGAGFGGLAAAHRLRTSMPDAEVVLVDRGDQFMMGFHKISWIVGREQPGDGTRRLNSVPGVRFINGTIDSIDAPNRAAVVGGERLDADALIIALGAEVDGAAVPGLLDHGHSIYQRDGATAAAAALSSMQSGKVLIAIFGAPYKCSPAPFELALLINDAHPTLPVTVASPLPMSLPVLGPAGCNPLEARLATLGIDFRPETVCERVEAGRVITKAGVPLPFDLLLGVAPHRLPAVAAELAGPSGWIKVNPRTLQTPHEGVFAIGDCVGIPLSNGQGLPKAGALAEEMGKVAADRIAGQDAMFSGEGACFLEVGGGEAMRVQGNFLADPPSVELTQPSGDQLALKHEWERERLAAWFG